MAAKKKNLYSSVDVSKLEKEVSNTIQYLEELDVSNIVDDINFDAFPKPQVISTVEKKIVTCLKVIQSSANIALALYEKHGMTELVEHLMFTAINSLKEVQAHYDNSPISRIEHRYVWGVKETKKGVSVSVKVLANSKEDQISSRVQITEKILAILPLIEEIEKVKATISLKGDKELPESVMY